MNYKSIVLAILFIFHCGFMYSQIILQQSKIDSTVYVTKLKPSDANNVIPKQVDSYATSYMYQHGDLDTVINNITKTKKGYQVEVNYGLSKIGSYRLKGKYIEKELTLYQFFGCDDCGHYLLITTKNDIANSELFIGYDIETEINKLFLYLNKQIDGLILDDNGVILILKDFLNYY